MVGLCFKGSVGVAVFLCTFTAIIGAGVAFNGTCQQQPNITVPAFINWPFDVNCNQLKDIWMTQNQSSINDTFDCRITHNGNSSSEGIFELYSIDDSSIYEAELIINDVSCISHTVYVKLEPFPETCSDVNDAYVHKKRRTKYDFVVLNCTTSDVGPLIIPEGADRNSFTTKWIIGCDPDKGYRYNMGWYNETPSNITYGKSLIMPRVDFCDATNFTCAVTYKNRTLHAATDSLSIKQKSSDIHPTVFCSSKQTGFSCNSDMAFGRTKPENIHIEWTKDGETLCKNRLFGVNVTVDTRFRCIAIDQSKNASFDYYNYSDDCTEDPQPKEKNIDLQFYISDIEKEDYDSTYTIVFGVRHIDGLWSNTTQGLTLEKNFWSEITTPVIVVGSLVAFVFVLIVLGFVLSRQIRFLRWWRDVCSGHEKVSKPFVAYLSYHIDHRVRSEQMDATKKIVTAIDKILKELNYPFYDEQKGGWPEGSVLPDNLPVLSDFHRIVIVLSKDYLDEKGNAREKWNSLPNLLKSKIRLIFVLTPEVQRYMDQAAENDTNIQAVVLALHEGHSVIHWKPNMSEESFRDHFEYALPKLKSAESTSSLSSCESEMENGTNDQTIDHPPFTSQTTLI